MKMPYSSLVAIAFALCTARGENLLVNGSFESPGNLAPDSGLVFVDQDKRLTGWTVALPDTNSSVALFHGMYLPQLDFMPVDGEYQLVFNGGNRPAGGIIAQTFDTISGEDYEITFFVGRLGDGPGQVSLTASVTSDKGQQLATLMAVPPPHGYGYRMQLVFKATTARSTLFFTDTSPETISVDIALDDVVVSPLIPEATIRVSQVEICWSSLADRTYQVQYQSQLTTNMWTNLGAPMKGTGASMCTFDPVAADAPPRFYRVVKLP